MTQKDSDEFMERVHDTRHGINGLLGDIQTLKMKLADAHPEADLTYVDAQTEVLDVKDEMINVAHMLMDDAQSLNSWINFRRFGSAAQMGAESGQFDAAADAIAGNIDRQREVFWPLQLSNRDFEEVEVDQRGRWKTETVEYTRKHTMTLHDGTTVHICLDESGRSV